MAKLKPCPSCGSDNVEIGRVCGRYGGRGHWFYVECGDCFWCGKTKLFCFRAVRAWNKESKEKNNGNNDGLSKNS